MKASWLGALWRAFDRGAARARDRRLRGSLADPPVLIVAALAALALIAAAAAPSVVPRDPPETGADR